MHASRSPLLIAPVLLTLTAIVAGCSGGGASQPTNDIVGSAYILTPLPALPGDVSSVALGINNQGEVVGDSRTDNPLPPAASLQSRDLRPYYAQAVLYLNAQPQPLGIAPGLQASSASALNDRGQIVGTSSPIGPGFGSQIAFLWQNGVRTELSGLTAAMGINASGQIVGTAKNHAAVWQQGVVTPLPGLAGDEPSRANAINQGGLIVGRDDSNPIVGEAVTWSNGAVQDLGKLPGCIGSEALAANAAGQVVGYSAYPTAPPATHACLWQNGQITDLDAVPSAGYSRANSINNKGEIVGQGNVEGAPESHAFLWKDGRKIDLNSLLPSGSGWVLVSANGINDRGEIVGEGNKGAFLLTPRT